MLSGDSLSTLVADRRAANPGMLIVNADDWGRDVATTDRTLECANLGAVTAASAMVFMEDSERAAAIAREQKLDTGLHLNLTSPFTGKGVPARVEDHQAKLGKHLRRHRLAPIVFHPGLATSFEYAVRTQIDEYQRLYGAAPERVDGHHHMHHCANVLYGKLLPAGTIARRNFTFHPGEKSLVNRLFRSAIDHELSKRHRLVDCLYSLAPLQPKERLQRTFAEAAERVIELESHPINSDEFEYLTKGEFFRMTSEIRLGSFRNLKFGSSSESFKD